MPPICRLFVSVQYEVAEIVHGDGGFAGFGQRLTSLGKRCHSSQPPLVRGEEVFGHPLKHGHGIYRRAGGVLQAQGVDADHEGPAVALAAGLGDVLEVGVVQDPQAHGGDGHLVHWIGELARILGRAYVVSGIGAEDGDVAFLEEGETCRLTRGGTGFAGHRALNRAPVELSGSHEEHIARLNAEPAALLGGQDVVGHDALAAFHPVDTADEGHIHQHAAGDKAVSRLFDGAHGGAEAGGHHVGRLAVVGLAVPRRSGPGCPRG